jgi:hypothetical protein
MLVYMTPMNRLAKSELAVDKGSVEQLLFALATELRVVPLESSTRALHIRALEIKGAVSRWIEGFPDKHTRDTVRDEVLALRRAALECRERLRATPITSR